MGTYEVRHEMDDDPNKPANLYVLPYSGEGMEVTFVADYHDPQGANNLWELDLLVNDDSDIFDAAFVKCVINTTGVSLRLYKDKPIGWPPYISRTLRPDTTGTISNSQVTIDLAQCSLELSEEVATFTVKMIFKPSFIGLKNIYLQAKDKTGEWNTKEKLGEWYVTN